MEQEGLIDHLSTIFSTAEMLDIIAAANERKVKYRDLIRQAVLEDLHR